MILHVCNEGELITDIGKKYGVSPVKLLEDNGFPPERPLLEGDVIAVFPSARCHTVAGGESAAGICENTHSRKRISSAAILPWRALSAFIPDRS